MFSHHLFACLLLFLILLSSCAPVRSRPVGEPVSQSFASELMQEWQELSARVESVKGLAKVEVKVPWKSLTATQVLLAEKPGHLRAETLSAFGSPLLLLAVDDGKLGVSLPPQNIFYTGAATPENLALFVHIALLPNDLVGALLYSPPLIDAWKEEAFTLQEGGWLLVRHGALRRQELVFNPLRQLVEVSYLEKNELFMRISYADFSALDDFFPHRFQFELPGEGSSVNLEFSDLETNGVLRQGIFQLAPPQGAKVVYMPDVFVPD